MYSTRVRKLHSMTDFIRIYIVPRCVAKNYLVKIILNILKNDFNFIQIYSNIEEKILCNIISMSEYLIDD